MPRFVAQSQLSVLVLAIVSACMLLEPTRALADPATTQRPLSDFLSQQGTFCPSLPHPSCPGFATNYVGFSGFNRQLGTYDRFGVVDYAGLEPVAGLVGTSVDGRITERRRADGKYEVRIALRTRNALTVVRALDFTSPDPFNGPILFGHPAAEVAAGAQPALSDIHIDVTLITLAPGAPLPDLVRYGAGDPTAPELAIFSEQINALGPLRTAFGVLDGTPGRMHSTQTGLIRPAIRNGFKGALVDAFPAELINLQVVGR